MKWYVKVYVRDEVQWSDIVDHDNLQTTMGELARDYPGATFKVWPNYPKPARTV